MFFYAIGDHYFDVLTKTFITYKDLSTKKRFQFKGNPIEIIQRLKNEKAKKEMYIILTVTTECDLSCKYCFENGTERHSMSYDEIRKIISKVKEYLLLNKIESLYCTIFGGEPMLVKDKVEYVVKELYSFCIINNINIEFSMNTNGLIIDKEYFIMLYGRNLKTIQLTFDGSKVINNERRKYRTMQNVDVYSTIINNLNIFLNVFDKINIKFNFDKQNLYEFDTFLSDVSTKIATEYLEKIVILVEAIQKTHSSNYKFGYQNTEKELALGYVDIIKMILDKKFKYKSKVFNTPCMATSYNSFLIEPSGYCSCCISNFIQNELSLGKFEDISIEKSYTYRQKLNRIEILDKNCRNCDFLASCWGGCLYELSVCGKQIFENVNCRKQFYKTFLEAFYNEIYLVNGVSRIE